MRDVLPSNENSPAASKAARTIPPTTFRPVSMEVGGVGSGVGVCVIVGVTGKVAVEVDNPRVGVTGTGDGVGVSVDARLMTKT